MRRILSFILFFVSILSISAQLNDARALFFSATDIEGMKKFYHAVNIDEPGYPVLLAYKGVATSMQAEVTSSVIEKFDYFDAGKQLIETAVVKDWYNPEIRFLRFSVQTKVPFFLGYKSQLKEDANLIIDELKKKNIDVLSSFWTNALLFMQSSGELSSEQLRVINASK